MNSAYKPDAESLESKSWSAKLDQPQTQPPPSAVAHMLGSNGTPAGSEKPLNSQSYYGCYGEATNQSTVTASVVKRNQSQQQQQPQLYNSSGHRSPVSTGAANQMYGFGTFRKQQTVTDYSVYTSKANSGNLLVNTYANCNNGQAFDGTNGKYDYGSNMGSQYKNCDYVNSKLFDVQYNSYTADNGGFGSQLSSPENYENYGYEEQQQQQQSGTKYMGNYGAYHHDTATNACSRIPSEYSAITLKQEQQLIAGGCGYSSINHYPYYESSTNSQIAIASSPNSITGQRLDSFKPSYDQSHFNPYCDGSTGSGGYPPNQYDFLGTQTDITPEYYQLS